MDRQLARVSTASRALQGIVHASRQLYTALLQVAHCQPKPGRLMAATDKQVPRPPNLQFTPASLSTQFLPPPASQFPPPLGYYLPPTSQPPPPPGFPIPQYTPSVPPPTTPQTRPPSILVSRPDSPKPVLAVPPVHRTTSHQSLSTTAAGEGSYSLDQLDMVLAGAGDNMSGFGYI